MGKMDILKNNENKNLEKKITEEGITKEKIFDLEIIDISDSMKEQEIKDLYGKTTEEIKKDIQKLYSDTKKKINEGVSDYYKKDAIKDLDNIFNNVINIYCKFISNSMITNLKNIFSRIEKILAIDSNFYNNETSVRNEEIKKNVINFIPNKYIKTFSPILTNEINNSFSIFYPIINEINAQDFILSKDFINIQYKLDEFFVIDIPEYLKPVNDLVINHICTNYIYERSEKFDNNNAIKDYEEEGYRINIIHGSLRDNKCPTLFIRKNTHGFTRINDKKYFLDLFSNVKVSDEKKLEWVNMMQKISSGDIDMSFFIVGKTGSGKTTLMRELILLDEYEQNRLTIEDTPELFLPNTISYVTNKKYGIHEIFISTLRQNPTSVFVGETREGQILLDILELSLTAHSGSTLHAADMRKCLSRIELMCGNLMPIDTLYNLLTSTIGMWVFMKDRKITELYFRNDKIYKGDFYECYDKMF